MASYGKSVHLVARDAEAVRDVFGGLAHEEADHWIGQPLHDADDRREQRLHRQTAKQASRRVGVLAAAMSENHSTILSP